jgi:RimJ/RimL family protein N-acetyltransferase
VTLDDGALAGRVGFRVVDLAEGYAEVAHWVLPAARGRGVATRAVAVLTGWAFGLGLHRLEKRHAAANAASCRVADRSGSPLEGTRYSSVLHEDGWHDMHVHARLAVG